MAVSPSRSLASPFRGPRRRQLLALALLALVVFLSAAAPALAGQASSGELLFYPCTSCHPVTMIGSTPSRALPNGFKGHGIVLEGHDKLGTGDRACLACHDEANRNPGKLKLADGSLIDIKGDIAQVCYRCHSAKYKEFKAGAHGKHKPSCVAAGCHDPHTPSYIYASPLMPFTGSGFQFRGVSERVAFAALAPPSPDAPVNSPAWYVAFIAVGLVTAGGLIGKLVTGRLKR